MKLFFYLLVFFTCCLLCSCNVSKELRNERKEWEYKIWGKKFKDRALCLCILKGMNNKSIEDSILKYDKSLYSPLAIAIFDDTLKSLIDEEIITIQKDSINSIGKFPADLSSLLQGKKVLNHCINFYNSNRLNALTKIEKQKWSKINSIIEKVWEKIPSY